MIDHHGYTHNLRLWVRISLKPDFFLNTHFNFTAAYNCDDQSCLHIFLRSSNIYLSYLHLQLWTNANFILKLINNSSLFPYILLILFRRFLLSFSFDWEDKSNTQDSVWQHFQTPRSSSKILRCALCFQRCSRCLEMWPNTVLSVWCNTSRSLQSSPSQYFVRLIITILIIH